MSRSGPWERTKSICSCTCAAQPSGCAVVQMNPRVLGLMIMPASVGKPARHGKRKARGGILKELGRPGSLRLSGARQVELHLRLGEVQHAVAVCLRGTGAAKALFAGRKHA